MTPCLLGHRVTVSGCPYCEAVYWSEGRDALARATLDERGRPLVHYSGCHADPGHEACLYALARRGVIVAPRRDE